VVIATAEYGHEFAAIVGRGNVLGMQFHPEKSQAVGLKLIENFVLEVAARAGRRSSALAGRPA
jgi:imidazoleglycerol phosphate synthase glutamine amidotransferase subunit HisH